MTLLKQAIEKTKQAKTHPWDKDIPFNEALDVAIAFMNGDISTTATANALTGDSYGSVYPFILRIVKLAISEGKLKIEKL